MPVRSVAAGNGHVVAVTVTGAALSWGCNSHGQCGLGAAAERVFEPRLIAAQASACDHSYRSIAG